MLLLEVPYNMIWEEVLYFEPCQVPQCSQRGGQGGRSCMAAGTRGSQDPLKVVVFWLLFHPDSQSPVCLHQYYWLPISFQLK